MPTPDEFLSERRRLRWYLAGAFAGVGGACAAIVFALATFATAADVHAVESRTAAVEALVPRVDKLETQLADELSEHEFMKQQLWEIARTVGARALPAPAKR